MTLYKKKLHFVGFETLLCNFFPIYELIVTFSSTKYRLSYLEEN